MKSNLINRRRILGAIPAAAATLASTRLLSQDVPPMPDVTLREIDLLGYRDGLAIRENDTTVALPLIHRRQPAPFAAGLAVAELDDAPVIPAGTLVNTNENAAFTFNIFAPEPGDDTLFGTGAGGSALVVKSSPSFQADPVSDTGKVGKHDGTIEKEFNIQIARFQAFGIIRDGLPMCVPGKLEGIWMKLDVLGWLMGSWNRWETFAEGSLGRIVDQPGTYQFYWNKPTICGVGATNRDAIYNGILNMLRDLVKQVAGKIGRAVDDLLHLSPSIAAYLADALIKWLGTTTPAAADFTVSASPTTATVRRGQSVSYNIQVNALNGSTPTVALTASGRTGSTVSFSPSSIKGSGTSRFSVRTASSSPVGAHPITITAQSGNIRKETTITINIQ